MALGRAWDRSGPLSSGGSPPIDGLPAPALAWSSRKLITSYVGQSSNIRRSSDNTAQDIGFVGGDLDVASFNAFVGGGNGFIARGYDQSGNGNDIIQGVLANQPQLVTSVAALNNRPAPLFVDATAMDLAAASSASINNPFAAGGYISLVCTLGIATGNRRLFVTPGGGATLALSGTALQYRQAAVTTVGVWVTSAAFPIGAHQFDISYSSASLSNVPTIAWDGATQAQSAPTQPVGAITTDTGLLVGGDAGTSGWPGYISEFIVWKTTVPSAAQITALRANQKAYWGTP